MIHPFQHPSPWAERRMLGFAEQDRRAAFDDVKSDAQQRKADSLKETQEGAADAKDKDLKPDQKAIRFVRQTLERTDGYWNALNATGRFTEKGQDEYGKKTMDLVLTDLARKQVQEEIEATRQGLAAGMSQAEQVIRMHALTLNRETALCNEKIALCDKAIQALGERIDLLMEEAREFRILAGDIRGGKLRGGGKDEWKPAGVRPLERGIRLLTEIKQEAAQREKGITKEQQQNKTLEDERRQDALAKVDALASMLTPGDPQGAGEIRNMIDEAVTNDASVDDAGKIQAAETTRWGRKTGKDTDRLDAYITKRLKNKELTAEQVENARRGIRALRGNASAKSALGRRLMERDTEALKDATKLNQPTMQGRLDKLAASRIGQRVKIGADTWVVAEPKIVGKEGMTYLTDGNGRELIIERTVTGDQCDMTIKEADGKTFKEVKIKLADVTDAPKANGTVNMKNGADPRVIHFDTV